MVPKHFQIFFVISLALPVGQHTCRTLWLDLFKESYFYLFYYLVIYLLLFIFKIEVYPFIYHPGHERVK